VGKEKYTIYLLESESGAAGVHGFVFHLSLAKQAPIGEQQRMHSRYESRKQVSFNLINDEFVLNSTIASSAKQVSASVSHCVTRKRQFNRCNFYFILRINFSINGNSINNVLFGPTQHMVA